MELRLVDLEPEWVSDARPGGGHRRDEQLNVATAQGVLFLDPVEFIKNGGPVGTSSVLVWFRDRGVPADAFPGPGRWAAVGSGFHDLTLSPSVDLSCGGKYPGRWHGWVRNGLVT